ncbi:hypothetical protein BK008_11220 [Methanobacterium sp. MZ-A1]|uniref:hypothetical protein n=1 Tax=Methanobacterium sp. MZ-A1 TaxID=1911685 RepID=UPI000C2D5ABC|nr:hypothetical protein [Methanobacterium sp. MZ-A1]AUB58820.1 hypothetical protein BK008_11220 [Methanobacterium sp. MZ-A1]
MRVDYKTTIIMLILALSVVMVSGCATDNYKTFDKAGLSLQYPGNWTEISAPATDQQLANQSGFNITGVFIDGKSIDNYTFIMEIGVGNITNSTLTAAADNLNNNYIIKEANQAPFVNRTSLKNGYDAIVYTYNATGASSRLTVFATTYVFTKDNKTAYYIIFATPSNNTAENQKVIQNIVDSITIK